MKKVFLIIVYIFGLAACVGYRIVQITSMISPETGFLLREFESSKPTVYIIVGAFVLILILLGVFSKGLPQKGGRSITLGIASLLLGAVGLAVTAQLAIGFRAEIGLSLYIVSAAAFSVFMFYYGGCRLIGKRVAPAAALIPVLFAAVRFVIVFLQYYGLAKTIDIVLEIIMLAASLLFWHYFARFTAGVKMNSTPRWLVGFSLSASLLCLSTTLPVYFAKLFTDFASVREVAHTAYFDLATGVFILVFVIATAAGKNEEDSVGIRDNADR